MAVMSVSDILEEVARRAVSSGIRIVGIDGPSGSGKSTVARLLADFSAAPVIECDDFVSWDNVSDWWPRFEEQVLDPLLAGRDPCYAVRDWTGDEFGSSVKGFKTVPWAPLVIIDGVTCTRAAAGDRVCFRIWVEAPDELRLARGIERDGESYRDLWQRWMFAERRFFDEDGTRGLADLVVDGAPVESHTPGCELVVKP